MSIKSVMPSNLSSCRPLILLPSIFPNIRVFSNESVLHIRWPRYWSFSFSISPPNECSGLMSCKIYLFGLLAVQGTLKCFFQHHSSKSQFFSGLSVFHCPAFTFIHDYWKNHSFDYTNFGGKVMSLLFNMLSRLVIVFLPRSKHLLISSLQSPSAVILELKKIICHCFHCFPIYLS